jgi:hypothetical protein
MADKQAAPEFSLYDLLKMGARSSLDALQQDIGDILSLRLPRQGQRAAGDMLMAFNNPLMGTAIPRVPAYISYSPDRIAAINSAVERAKSLGSKNLDALLRLQSEVLADGGLVQVGYATPECSFRK